ncbi:MAG: hypothetical protein LBP91_01555 [Coriobacteriales bacterium]|jgi:divalent metal cation (Fe/Co/Zn/Cd) transporter|nr:hypothetical protein [Coriobacteriales bacterium]
MLTRTLRILTSPAPKQLILLFGTSVMLFPGLEVMYVGIKNITRVEGWSNPVVLALALAVLLLFAVVILRPFARRNSNRVATNTAPASLWTAYKPTDYLIIISMIALGLVVRTLLGGYPVIIGTFYLGLGAALALNGLYYLSRLFVHPKTHER